MSLSVFLPFALLLVLLLEASLFTSVMTSQLATFKCPDRKTLMVTAISIFDSVLDAWVGGGVITKEVKNNWLLKKRYTLSLKYLASV